MSESKRIKIPLEHPVEEDSSIEDLKLKENIDGYILDLLIKSDMSLEKTKKGNPYSNFRTMLIEYKKLMKGKGKKYVDVVYSSGSRRIGRRYAVGSQSQGCTKKKFRHTLAEKFYIDVDMDNAQPTILWNIVQDNLDKFPNTYPCLTSYVHERKSHLDRIIQKYGVEKDEAKTLFIRMMFYPDGNAMKSWQKDNNLLDEPEDEFAVKFQREMVEICNTIFGGNNNQIFKRVYEEDVDKDEDYYNQKGSMLAYFCQDWERRIHDEMFAFYKSFFPTRKVKWNFVSCFDGGQILRDDWQEINKDRKFLQKLSKHIEEKLGFRINFSVKPMDQSIASKIVEQKREQESEVLDETKLKEFDKEYFKTLCFANKRTLAYQYFNKFVVKCIKPSVWVKINPDGIEIQNLKDLEHWMNDVGFMDDESKKKIPFFQEWLKKGLSDIREVDEVIFYPYGTVEDPEMSIIDKKYNSFRGMNPNILRTCSAEKEAYYRSKIIELWRPLFGGTDKPQHFEYNLKLIACHTLYPRRKLNYILTLSGSQGSGRGLFHESIASMYKKRNCVITDNVENVFGVHGTAWVDKIFFSLDELEYEASKKYEGTIKTFATASQRDINEKFMPLREKYPCFHFLMMFTNKSFINIDFASGDRRFIVHECDTRTFEDKPNAKEIYWEEMAAIIQDPDFAGVIYRYFQEQDKLYDLKNYKFENERPTDSDKYQELKQQSCPLIVLFLKDFIYKTSKYGPQQSSSGNPPIAGPLNSLRFKREGDKYEKAYYCSIECNDENGLPMDNVIDKTFSIKGTELHECYKKYLESRGMKLSKGPQSTYFLIKGQKLPIEQASLHGATLFNFNPKTVIEELNKQWIE